MGEFFTIIFEFTAILLDFVFSKEKRAESKASKKQFPQRKRVLQDTRASQRGNKGPQ